MVCNGNGCCGSTSTGFVREKGTAFPLGVISSWTSSALKILLGAEICNKALLLLFVCLFVFFGGGTNVPWQ